MRQRKYETYSSEEFKSSLDEIGINPGDSIFVVHSMDNIDKFTGNRISPRDLLNDILEYLGPKGNLMTLCFSLDRKSIINGKTIFDIKKTPTMSGLLAELLRRRSNSVRSMHPIWSAVAVGPKAKYYCSEHHLSKYPFDEFSPYWKMTKDGGKYLGIGAGFEAFTPIHMLDDYFKKKFKHKVYSEENKQFICIDGNRKEQMVYSRIRHPKTRFDFSGFDPHRYFNILDIRNISFETGSGIKLLTFSMDECLHRAIEVFMSKKITVWNTRTPACLVKKIIFCGRMSLEIVGKVLWHLNDTTK